jgi:hypothetical protein
MKKKVFLLIFSTLIVAAFFTLQSCHKSAFPRDPYRGASANPKSYPQKHDKAKNTRAYRSVKVKRTY